MCHEILTQSVFAGISQPRDAFQRTLPSSSSVVESVLRSRVRQGSGHEGLTSLSGLWSELVLRDIAATVHPADRGDRCCSSDEEKRHPECYEMEVLLPDGRSGCSRYWRSVPSLTVHGCQFETREQMNGASAYLDGSVVYGDTDDRIHRLRTYQEGQVDLECGKFCEPTESTVALNALRRVLLREHNRVAERLAATNVHWDDTKLFLEARRIVVAQLQHVTLNEYVLAVLGEGVAPELAPLANGFHQGYSSSNQAGTYDAVALTALHALARTSSVRFENSTPIENHVTTSAERIDFSAASGRLIHMGRDHGVPGYVEFLDDCLGVKVGFMAQCQGLDEFCRKRRYKSSWRLLARLLSPTNNSIEHFQIVAGEMSKVACDRLLGNDLS